MKQLLADLRTEHRLDEEKLHLLKKHERRNIAISCVVWMALFAYMYFNDPRGVVSVAIFIAVMAAIVTWQYHLLNVDLCKLYTVGKRVQGKVISVEKDRAVVWCRGLVAFFEFTDAQGNVVKANMPLPKKLQATHGLQNGQEVTVMYLENDPKESEIFFEEKAERFDLGVV